MEFNLLNGYGMLVNTNGSIYLTNNDGITMYIEPSQDGTNCMIAMNTCDNTLYVNSIGFMVREIIGNDEYEFVISDKLFVSRTNTQDNINMSHVIDYLHNVYGDSKDDLSKQIVSMDRTFILSNIDTEKMKIKYINGPVINAKLYNRIVPNNIKAILSRYVRGNNVYNLLSLAASTLSSYGIVIFE